MKHPETGGLTQTTDEAFAEVWRDLGWEAHDPTIEEQAEVRILSDQQFEETAKPLPLVMIIHTGTLEYTLVPDNEAVDETWGPLGWVRASTDEDGNPIVPPDGELLHAESGTGPDVQDEPKPKRSHKAKPKAEDDSAPEEV